MRKEYTKGKITLQELLMQTKRTSSGCLEWTASTDRNGYGQVRRGKKLYIATRLAMHFTQKFDLSSPYFILHHCDNPKCLNTKHLYVGTQTDNTRDRMKRKRGHQGERHFSSKFCDKTIQRLRADYENGLSQLQLAKKYGIEQSYVSRLINNKARAL